MPEFLRQPVECQCGYALLRSIMGTTTCWYVYQDTTRRANSVAPSIVPFITVCPACGVALNETTVESAEEEERRWDELFARPHVQRGLQRLEEEAERQYLAGETLEGGFADE